MLVPGIRWWFNEPYLPEDKANVHNRITGNKVYSIALTERGAWDRAIDCISIFLWDRREACPGIQSSQGLLRILPGDVLIQAKHAHVSIAGGDWQF